MGIKVNGANCVGSDRPANVEPAFFVVGGQVTGSQAASDDYTGLQKFTYSTGKWTTVQPSNLVTKHRQWHTSAYIEADDSILIFGGNQDGKMGPYSDTFSVKATAPYTVTMHSAPAAPNAPPASLRPIITKYTNSDVLMVGGGTDIEHTKIFLFNPNAGWRFLGSSLEQPLQKDTESIQGICVTGSDQSMTLVLFDLAQSPNKVTRVVVRGADGKINDRPPFISARAVAGEIDASNGGLTLSNWPEYNSTFAPKETRQKYAAVGDSKNRMIFTGGNPDNPIAMFDAAANSWINTSAYFVENQQRLLVATTTSSSAITSSTAVSSSSTDASSISTTTTATATALPTPSDKPEDSGPSSNAILGITLGSIAGFLVLLGLILLCLRRRRRAQGHAEAGGTHSPANEKDMAAFSRGLHSPAGHLRGHRPQASAESYSSVAILMGRVNNKEKSGLSRKPSNDTARSSVSSLHKQFKSKISKPIPQAEHPALQSQDERGVAFAPSVGDPRPRNRPAEASDGTRRSSGWNRYWSGGSALQILGFGNGKRATVVSEQSSQYSEAVNNPRVTQDSATVPPLSFDGRPRVNSVNSGSPVVAQHPVKMPFTEGMSGTIERPVSSVSSGYSSGIPESINEVWDPAESKKPWGANRAPGDAYSASNPYHAAETSTSGQRAPSGVSRQPQLAMAATSDMSWLNLGDASRR